MANPQYVTLAGDVEKVVTLDAPYGQIKVTMMHDPDAKPVYFNASDTTIGAVASSADGNLSIVSETGLVSETATVTMSGVTKVHLRCAGNPTVCVRGL